MGTSWPEAQWAQVWHDLLEARQAGLSVQLPAADLAAAFLRVLLLAQQCHLAVQFLPLRTQQQLLAGLAQGGTPNARTPTAMDGMGAFDLAMDAAAVQQHSAGSFMADHAAAAARDADRPVTAEAALAALTGGGGGMFPGRSRFGVRKALHNAAGAAVSTAVGSTAKLMGVSANLVGSTAHLVGSTAQAVQYGTGGVMGATAGLVSGTASLVSSAATFAAEAAAKAGSKAGTVFKGSSGGNVDLRGATGLLTVAEAEAVVVQVSKELLGSAASLSDPGVAAAEAVLQLLPPECKVRPCLDLCSLLLLKRCSLCLQCVMYFMSPLLIFSLCCALKSWHKASATHPIQQTEGISCLLLCRLLQLSGTVWPSYAACLNLASPCCQHSSPPCQTSTSCCSASYLAVTRTLLLQQRLPLAAVAAGVAAVWHLGGGWGTCWSWQHCWVWAARMSKMRWVRLLFVWTLMTDKLDGLTTLHVRAISLDRGIGMHPSCATSLA